MSTLQFRKSVFIALAMALALGASGCGNSSGGTASPSTSNVTTTTSLSMNPPSATVTINTITQFTASGGTAPYLYSLLAGGGSINASSGYYIAPAAASNAIVRVTDATGQTASSSVTILTSGSTSTAPCTNPDERLVIQPYSYNATTLICSGGCYLTGKSYSGTNVPCSWTSVGTYAATLTCYNNTGATVDANHVRLTCAR